MNFNAVKPLFYGILASIILLGVYFAALTLVSGWSFAQSQFASFWYFIVSLAIGFGIQIGLYNYLGGLIKNSHHGESKMLGVTGTTSTAAMISCCAHYLTNILPVLGVVGIVTFVAQYQVQLFWVGLLFNLGGIFYMINKINTFKQNMKYTRFIMIGLILAFLLYGFFIIYQSRTENGAQNTPIPTDQSKAQKQQWETKTDDQPPVTVEVTPVELGKDAQNWKFDIAFNTHSVELDEDIMQIATLVDDKANAYKPIAWEGAGPGGHHREGILVFNAIHPIPQSIELKIKDIGGIVERSFGWNIQ